MVMDAARRPALFARATDVTTAASYVNTPVTGPAICLPKTVTTMAPSWALIERAPEGTTHVSDVADVHFVASQAVMPMRAAAELSWNPNDAPMIVDVAPPVVGPLFGLSIAAKPSPRGLLSTPAEEPGMDGCWVRHAPGWSKPSKGLPETHDSGWSGGWCNIPEECDARETRSNTNKLNAYEREFPLRQKLRRTSTFLFQNSFPLSTLSNTFRRPENSTPSLLADGGAVLSVLISVLRAPDSTNA
jgi:hypothetical protein